MKASELVSFVRAEAGIEKEEAVKAIAAVSAAIRNGAANGEKVTLPDLGTFRQVNKPSRQARNPRTGEIVEVPARSVVAFRPTKSKANER